MIDNLKIKTTEDPLKINTDQERELNYWSNKFGVSKAKIFEAVLVAGEMVTDVKKYLGK